MHGQGKEITTPNPKAAPPSAVKDVGESRQERLKRQQARFRDRGGIFVPTARNTLAGILLGRKGPSPKKHRGRSRSASVSPVKLARDSNPAPRKAGKRPSLSAPVPVQSGKLSVGNPAPRRSPRKSNAQVLYEGDTDDDVPLRAKTPKKSKQSKAKAATPKGRTPKGKGKAVDAEEPQTTAKTVTSKSTASSSTPSSSKQAQSKLKRSAKPAPIDANDGEGNTPLAPKPSSKRAKGKVKASSDTSIPSTSSKKSKNLPPVKEVGEGECDSTSSNSCGSTRKRKLSIVAEEEEEEKAGTPASHPQSSSTLVGDPEEEPGSPPPKRAKVTTDKNKQATSKKPKPLIPPDSPVEQPIKAIQSKPQPKKRKHDSSPAPEAEAAQSSKRKAEEGPNADEVPEPAAKKIKTKARAAGRVEEFSEVKATKSKQATPKVPDSAESGPKNAKRTKTSSRPLKEIHPDAGDSDHETPKKPSKSSKPSKLKPLPSRSRKQKENTPMSDVGDFVVPVKGEGSKASKGRKRAGPRPSAVVRIGQPLPPIEDNDPDPIDFLS